MTISLSDAGKRFNREWIFRHITYTFQAGNAYAIIGPNGSGKSTLLQVLSGSMHYNEGKVEFHPIAEPSAAGDYRAGSRQPEPDSYRILQEEDVYKHISICAPYLELIEEMTLKEFLVFHQEFKPFLEGITIDRIITTLGLEKAANKQIRYYSSGMKQRVKLAQCIFSNTAVLLLDEPCTNLDTTGITLYHQLIDTYARNRLVVVSSNDEVEYRFCKERLLISDYKN